MSSPQPQKTINRSAHSQSVRYSLPVLAFLRLCSKCRNRLQRHPSNADVVVAADGAEAKKSFTLHRKHDSDEVEDDDDNVHKDAEQDADVETSDSEGDQEDDRIG